jgi:hypothetical protein
MEDDESTDLFYGDAWFVLVEVAIYTKLEFDSDFVGPVKMGHLRTWLVLAGKCDEGVDLIAIGYKYSLRDVLSCTCTKGAGNTMPGDPYKACWMDSKGNHSSRNITWPDAIVGGAFHYFMILKNGPILIVFSQDT